MSIRHDWTEQEIEAIYDLPFADLMHQAQSVHRQNFDPNKMQMSTLINIKTGACPEDCAYCPQSGHYNTGLQKEKLMPLLEVIRQAKNAKDNGATRFCMGAAWRSPSEKNLPQVTEMIKAVKALGLETCATLGMVEEDQAQELKEAGLDYYNHNLDSSPEYYKKIITTRTYDDRLNTLGHVRKAGIKVCCGGILGMGETKRDRILFLQQLVNLPEHPESVPLNKLINIPGTPLEEEAEIDNIDFVRAVATARILMPKAYVRLSAGRKSLSDELQALCYLAGANSIHFGENLLVTKNQEMERDRMLFQKLGINADSATC